MEKAGIKGGPARAATHAGRKLRPVELLWPLSLSLFLAGLSFWVDGSAYMALVVASVVAWIFAAQRTRVATTQLDDLEERVRGVEAAHRQQVHPSIHHLFRDRDLLRPRAGGNVDIILDAADLPPDLDDYLGEIKLEGAEARILILDPKSDLVRYHRFVPPNNEDSRVAVEEVRSKIQKAIQRLQPMATVRLHDSVPPGNLVIVDDHIFWGGLPGIATDVPLPILGITADTREHVYWAFRRNFDMLWKQSKPVEPPKLTTTSLTAASL